MRQIKYWGSYFGMTFGLTLTGIGMLSLQCDRVAGASQV